jgi:hypothetical protein
LPATLAGTEKRRIADQPRQRDDDLIWLRQCTGDLDACIFTAAAIGTSTAVANPNLVSSNYTVVPSTGGTHLHRQFRYTGRQQQTIFIDTTFNPVTATLPLIGSE